MATLFSEPLAHPLTTESLAEILLQICARLKGRVLEAHLFGSAARGDFRPDSDLDLALVVQESTDKFPRRPFAFLDLFDLYPRLDLLVYTRREWETLIDSKRPFWVTFRKEGKRVL